MQKYPSKAIQKYKVCISVNFCCAINSIVNVKTIAIYRKDKETDKHRNKNRSRKYGIVIYISEDEKYILDEKTKCYNMASRADFIRHLILYGYVYDVDYSELREYNSALAKISNNLNQIAKRMNATGNFVNLSYM